MQPLINFDSTDDSSLGEQIYEPLALIRGLSDSLVEQDHSRHVLFQIRSREQKLSVSLAVRFGVLHAQRNELEKGLQGREEGSTFFPRVPCDSSAARIP